MSPSPQAPLQVSRRSSLSILWVRQHLCNFQLFNSSLNLLLYASCMRARVSSRCRQYFSTFSGSCASHSVANMMETRCRRSRPACNWNVERHLLVFSGPSDLSSAKKGTFLYRHTWETKMRCLFVFVELVVFIAVREDLCHCGSFDQTCCQKVSSLHYFSKHPNALQNCAFPSPSRDPTLI